MEKGADVVVLSTPALPAIDEALRSADRGGAIHIFAAPEPGTTIPYPLWELWRDRIRIVPSYAGSPTDMRTALDAIADGRIDARR
jgi:L-iditol 2-dehydrogenase